MGRCHGRRERSAGKYRDLPGVDLSDSFVFYYAALPVVLLGLAAAWRIVHSPFGRVIAAIQHNSARARALGYAADRYKLVVFTVSAFLSGLAGGLYAVNHGFRPLLQEVFWTTSGKVVVMTVLGGIGTLWGSLLGAGAIVRPGCPRPVSRRPAWSPAASSSSSSCSSAEACGASSRTPALPYAVLGARPGTTPGARPRRLLATGLVVDLLQQEPER